MQDCGAGFERVRKWGLDLAGRNGLVNSLEGAGAIGGLLAVYDLNDTPGAEQTGDDLQYIYAYDGNGNVVQVLDWTVTSPPDAIVAEYEYDAYGNLLNSPPPPQQSYYWRNPFRFSTKQWDDETGFGYWEQRYYSPGLGRWISRDPIEEKGGVNLYVFVRNAVSGGVDDLGTQLVLPGGSRGYKRVCIDPTPQRPRVPKAELTNPLCGLTHFCFGGGRDACLSADLVKRLKHTQQYRDFHEDDIVRLAIADLLSDTAGPCKERTQQWNRAGSSSNLLTSPLIVTPTGGLDLDPNYCFSLNTTIGTIRDVQWSADCTTKALGPKGCEGLCFCPVTVDCRLRITITDTYDFRGSNNILLRWIPGRPFTITFTDSHKTTWIFPCSPPPTSK